MLDDFGGDTGDDAVVGDVAVDDGAGGQDSAVAADPDIVPEGDGQIMISMISLEHL